MLKYFILLYIFSFCLYADQSSQNLEARIGLSDSNNSEGNFHNLSYLYSKKNNYAFKAFYHSEDRLFTGGSKLNDSQIGLEVTQVLTNHIYVTGSYAHALEESFLPKSLYSLTPHLAWNSFDFWIGTRISDYSTGSVTAYNAGLLYDFSERFRLGGQVFSVDSNPTANSLHLFGVVKYKRFSFRGDFAHGKTLESAELVGGFTSYGPEINYSLTDKLSLGAAFTVYNGELRKEKRTQAIAKFQF